MRQIVLWLLRWLETSLDPDLQLRIQQFEAKVAAAEVEEKRLLGEIEKSRIKLTELALEFSDNQRKAVELDSQIAHAKEVAEAKKAELDSLSDREKVRLDL